MGCAKCRGGSPRSAAGVDSWRARSVRGRRSSSRAPDRRGRCVRARPSLPPRPLERAGARLGDGASALQDAALPLRRRVPRLPRRRGRAAPPRGVLRGRRDSARRWGSGSASPSSCRSARTISAAAARRNIMRMARQLIAGATPEDGAAAARAPVARGRGVPPSTSSARRRSPRRRRPLRRRASARCSRRWSPRRARPGDPQPRLERDPWGAVPRVNLSIKPTALSPLLRAAHRGRRPRRGARAAAADPARARARPAPPSTSTPSTTT